MDYTCKICGNQVSKRKSYAYEDGRACKTHDEAAEAAKKREEEQKAKSAALNAPKTPRNRKYKSIDVRKQCWLCRKEIVTLSEHYSRMLIALERDKNHGEFNFFSNPAKFMKLAGYEGGECMALPYEYLSLGLKKRLPLDVEMMGQMCGRVLFCSECATKYGLDPEKRLKELTAPASAPGVDTIKAMGILGALYEDSELHQKVKHAAKELDAVEE